MRRFQLMNVILAAAMMAGLTAAHAQPAWPQKPIRIVVPFAPGGNTDSIARVMAERFTQSLGQAVVRVPKVEPQARMPRGWPHDGQHVGCAWTRAQPGLRVQALTQSRQLPGDGFNPRQLHRCGRRIPRSKLGPGGQTQALAHRRQGMRLERRIDIGPWSALVLRKG